MFKIAISSCTFFDTAQVILSGQLVLTNLLAEHLECHVLPMADETSGPQGEGQNLIAVGRSTPPSVLLDANCKMVLRIRFYGLDSTWSGDIPLRENCRSGQPWLVKVPLHERWSKYTVTFVQYVFSMEFHDIGDLRI